MELEHGGIGGLVEKDPTIDIKKQTEALTYMLNQGMNFVEATMWYSEGASVEIFANALKQSRKNREDLFICQAIYIKEGKDFEKSKQEFDNLCDLLGTNYIDTLQFSLGSFLREDFNTITKWIDTLLAENKIRYTSIANENLSFLKKYHEKYQVDCRTIPSSDGACSLKN